MKIYDKKKVGRRTYTVVGEGNNLFDCAYDLSKLSFGDVENCGICGNDNLVLNARIAGKKKFQYVEIKCLSCKAALVFGKMAENPDMFFLRKVPVDPSKKDSPKKLDWRAFNPDQTEEDLEKLFDNK